MGGPVARGAQHLSVQKDRSWRRYQRQERKLESKRRKDMVPTSEVESSSKSTTTTRHRTFENSVIPSPARARGLCRGGGDMLLFDLEDGRQPHGTPAYRLCWRHGGAWGSGARPRRGWLALPLCAAEGAGRGRRVRFSGMRGMGPRRVRERVGERGERP